MSSLLVACDVEQHYLVHSNAHFIDHVHVAIWLISDARWGCPIGEKEYYINTTLVQCSGPIT
eukprot:scaffold604070_cov25-Prasinocladus_malaysianus.AAC.2